MWKTGRYEMCKKSLIFLIFSMSLHLWSVLTEPDEKPNQKILLFSAPGRSSLNCRIINPERFYLPGMVTYILADRNKLTLKGFISWTGHRPVWLN